MNTFERCINCTGERAELCKPFREMAGVRPEQTSVARLNSDIALEAFALFELLLAQRLGEIGCAHYASQEAKPTVD